VDDVMDNEQEPFREQSTRVGTLDPPIRTESQRTHVSGGQMSSTEEPSTEEPSTEEPSTERLSSEGLSTEQPPSRRLSTESLSTERLSTELAAGTEPIASTWTLGAIGDAACQLAQPLATRVEKSQWLKQLAGSDEVALHLVRVLGGEATELDVSFPCLLHNCCEVTLTRGGNGEILYQDHRLASSKRRLQTIAELSAAIHTGKPRQLRGLELAVWSLRLLNSAGLVELPSVIVPPVAPDSPAWVCRARDGFELLVRCRGFLDPGVPISYTRGFVEGWCGIAKRHSRGAIFALMQQGVIVRVAQGRPRSGRRPANLYLPGAGVAT
jgi:hypothetical protein